MNRHGGGTRRSSRLTFRRRLLLVRTLLRGPASREQLIASVDAELGTQGYPAGATAALKHDLDALKSEYGCTLRYHRGPGHYALLDLGELAIFDLPDEAMQALTFLDASFPASSDLPDYARVRALLARILLMLPAYRRAEYERHRARERTRGSDQSHR